MMLAALLLLCGGRSVAFGQPGKGDSGTVATPSKPKPLPNSPSTKVRTVVRTEVRYVTPTTGSLAVAAEPNASLLVEPLKLAKPPKGGKPEALEATVPEGQQVFIFNDLKPGLYRVAGTLAKHYPKETTVNIKANEPSAVRLDFPPIYYSITINTNVPTGDVRYAPEGEPLNRVAAIVNGKAQLSLAEGKYTTAISTNVYGYEIKRQTIEVRRDQVVVVNLNKNQITLAPFSASWTKSGLQEWEMPAAWGEDKQKLLVKGTGVGLPSPQGGYRYYKDFKLTSDARMVNGVAVSFALRAQDSRNYYLVQLTGAKSEDPHVLRLFLVNGGVARRIMGIPIPSYASRPMDAGRFFTVSMKVIDFDITVEIIDTDSGAPYPLGKLTDPEHSFAVGAPGIVVRENEENLIGRFIVCTGEECFRD
jgi:hypothetical protein